MEDKQLEQLEAFGYKNIKDVNRYTYNSALTCMQEFIDLTFDTFDKSQQVDDQDLSKYLIAASIKYFEDFTEAFKDIYTMYCVDTGHNVPSSLLGCLVCFKRDAELSDVGNEMIDFMYQRNKLVHVYYNAEFMTDLFLKAMHNYSDGMLEIRERLAAKVAEYKLNNKEIVK